MFTVDDEIGRSGRLANWISGDDLDNGRVVQADRRNRQRKIQFKVPGIDRFDVVSIAILDLTTIQEPSWNKQTQMQGTGKSGVAVVKVNHEYKLWLTKHTKALVCQWRSISQQVDPLPPEFDWLIVQWTPGQMSSPSPQGSLLTMFRRRSWVLWSRSLHCTEESASWVWVYDECLRRLSWSDQKTFAHFLCGTCMHANQSFISIDCRQ